MNKIEDYKFRLNSVVKFEDVDSFNVVHNIKYLYWLEWARTEYMRTILYPEFKGNFLMEFPVMVVHNNADYLSSISFNDEYSIYTRAEFIKKSSIGFENLITNGKGDIIVKSKSVMVHIDFKTKTKKEIPSYVKDKIVNYENDFSIIK
jgi:thioesterase III